MDITKLSSTIMHARTSHSSISTGICSKSDEPSTADVLDESASTALIKRDIETALPLLKNKLSRGKEHLFTGSAPFRMIQTVILADNAKGLPLSYFRSPKELENEITSLQSGLSEKSEKFITGSLRLTPQGHHAAVVGLIRRDESALLVLDSSYDPMQLKHFSRRASIAAKGTTTSFGTTYEAYLSDELKNIKNNSIYFTYLAIQASMSDCAAFSLLTIRNIIAEPNEKISYYNLLSQRSLHIASPNPAKLLPGMQRMMEFDNDDGRFRNKTFVLNSDKLLPPIHYVHTQSKRRLIKYCNTSPFVDQSIAKSLMDYHEKNRKRIYPALSLTARIIPRKANVSIRQVQIEALEDALVFVQEREKVLSNDKV